MLTEPMILNLASSQTIALPTFTVDYGAGEKDVNRGL